jgi:hypothetical protein
LAERRRFSCCRGVSALSRQKKRLIGGEMTRGRRL